MSDKDGTAELEELLPQIVAQFKEGDKEAGFESVIRAIELAGNITGEWQKEPMRIFTVRHPIEFIMIANSDIPGVENCQMRSPNIAEAFYLAGAAFYELEDYKQAQHLLETSLGFNPVSARTWLELSETYKKEGNWDKVIECAKKALEYAWMMMEIAHAHRAISFALSEQGELEEAAAHIVLSLDYVPNDRTGLDELDWIAHQGFDVSKMDLNRAIEICGEEDDLACSILVASSGFSILNSEDAPIQLREQAADMIRSWVRPLRNPF